MKRKTANRSPLLARPHVCGIGGIGMSGAAHLLLDMGCDVTGSDLRQSELTDQLESRGVRIAFAPTPSLAQSASCVIAPRSFPQTHAETQAAQSCGVPVLNRAEALSVILESSGCAALVCFGTTSRGKLPWLFKDSGFGRCAGSAIASRTPLLHAKLDRLTMIDIDEREFLCDPDAFAPFKGSDAIVSDWQCNALGYYQQKPFAQQYAVGPERFFDEIRSRLGDENSLIIAPDLNAEVAHELSFDAFRGDRRVDHAAFRIDIHRGELQPPDDWEIAPLPFFGTTSDASALAAALLWARCRNQSAMPKDVECIGWFHPVSERNYHDIRMHPVNVHNALDTLRLKSNGDAVGVAIRPFAQTLDGYDMSCWKSALRGADRLLVITPPYEGCAESSCDQFADEMTDSCGSVQTVSLQQAHEIAREGGFWLWSGAGDIL